MAAPRYLEKLESSDGLISITFPTAAYEWESSQALRTPEAVAAGAHYAYDHRGIAEGLKASGSERLRFLMSHATIATLDTNLDTLKEKVLGIGLGKLYTLTAAGVRRWAWARPTAQPTTLVRAGEPNMLSVSALEFRRESDWYDTSQTSTILTPNADPYTDAVSNAGNAKVYNAVITIKGTFTNPSITNLTTGYSFSSTRDGSDANHWLEVDCGAFTVRFSTDGGLSWSNDIALFSRGAYQAQFMVLAAGTNSLSIGGCNGATVTTEFYGAYH